MRLNEMPETAAADLAGLNDYLTAGLARNPGIKAAFYEWKSAYSRIAQEFSLPDPEFTYTDYIREVETRVGPQESSFALRQKFPLPDKLWIKKNRAVRDSEIAYQRFEAARLELIAAITDAYYEYAYLAKSILITKENMKLLSNLESVAQAKYTSGQTKNQDLLKVQVELGKLQNDILSLEDMRQPLMARLSSLLNLPENTVLPWTDESLEDLELADGLKETEILTEELKNNNPQLKALTEKIARETESLKLAKRGYFPDLTVGITQIQTGEAMNPSEDSGKDPLMVMFSVNLPIWFNRINAEIKGARAALNAAENERTGMENELSAKLAMVHYRLRNAFRQSRLYKDALLPKAAQTLSATQAAYEAGSMDFLALIDAQRVLLNFQLAYYRQNADYYQRLAELRSMIDAINYDNEKRINQE